MEEDSEGQNKMGDAGRDLFVRRTIDFQVGIKGLMDLIARG